MTNYSLAPGTTYQMTSAGRFVTQEIATKLLQSAITRLAAPDFADGDALQALTALAATCERMLKLTFQNRLSNGSWHLVDLQKHREEERKLYGIRKIADYLKDQLNLDVKGALNSRLHWESMVCLSRIRNYVVHGVPLQFELTCVDSPEQAFRHTDEQLKAFAKKSGVSSLTVKDVNGGWSVSAPFETLYSRRTVESYWKSTAAFGKALREDFEFMKQCRTLDAYIEILDAGSNSFPDETTVYSAQTIHSKGQKDDT